MIKIKNATKQGYLVASDGDGVDISPRMQHHRGTAQKGMAQTIKTSADIGVVVGGGTMKPKVIGGVGEKKSNGGTQYYMQDRIYDGEIATTTTTTHKAFQPNYLTEENNQLRIRKLTPKECFRLMGVKDEDSEKLDDLSDMVKYHLAGDSIVVDVLMNIFKQFF